MNPATAPAKLEKMKAGLRRILESEEDAVLLWVLRDARWADRQILGTERLPISQVF